jgi:hypothetical protein
MRNYNLKIKFKKLRGVCGYYHYSTNNKNLIEVNERKSQSKIIETLYHEYTHFVVDHIINDTILGKTKDVKGVIAISKKKFNSRKFNGLEHKACRDIEKYCTRRLEQLFNELN